MRTAAHGTAPRTALRNCSKEAAGKVSIPAHRAVTPAVFAPVTKPKLITAMCLSAAYTPQTTAASKRVITPPLVMLMFKTILPYGLMSTSITTIPLHCLNVNMFQAATTNFKVLKTLISRLFKKPILPPRMSQTVPAPVIMLPDATLPTTPNAKTTVTPLSLNGFRVIRSN